MSDLFNTVAAGVDAGSSLLNSVGSFFGIGNQAYMQRKAMRMQQNNIEVAREREDNAMQRRVQDLVAAGLHPTLAAGGPAASAVAGSGQVTNPAPISDVMPKTSILDSAQRVAQIKQTQAETQRLLAERDRVEADTQSKLDYTRRENEYQPLRLNEISRRGDEEEWRALLHQTQMSVNQAQSWITRLNAEYIKKHGHTMPSTSAEYDDFRSSLEQVFGDPRTASIWRPALDMLRLLLQAIHSH